MKYFQELKATWRCKETKTTTSDEMNIEIKNPSNGEEQGNLGGQGRRILTREDEKWARKKKDILDEVTKRNNKDNEHVEKRRGTFDQRWTRKRY